MVPYMSLVKTSIVAASGGKAERKLGFRQTCPENYFRPLVRRTPPQIHHLKFSYIVSIFARIDIAKWYMNQSVASKIAEYFATKPVVRAYVFGSYARGDNGPDSDIDILVSFDRNAKVSLFDHISMTYDLEDILGLEVDLVTEGTLLPRVAASAENDKVLVYERVS